MSSTNRVNNVNIALFGGMAGNMYVMAKALVEHGHQVMFIRDRFDRYAMSQPCWEDDSFTLPFEELAKTSNWSWQNWSDMERKLQWHPPEWLADPLLNDRPSLSGNHLSLFDRFFYRSVRKQYESVIDLMASCDLVITGGTIGACCAYLSGRPYLIMPHGGDLRNAAYPVRAIRQERIRPFRVKQQFLARKAFRATEAMITASPDACLATELSTRQAKRYISRIPYKWAHVPVKIYETVPPAERREKLNAFLDTHFSLPPIQAVYVGIVPSRIDYYWKGHDRILPALRGLEPGALNLIFSGWGSDFHRFQDEAKGLPVTFLPGVVSKPLLVQLFQSVDFVVDQFYLNGFGTSTMEAMACGKPVMVNSQPVQLDEEEIRNPPVLNCQTPGEIADCFAEITSGRLDLASIGQRAQEEAGYYRARTLSNIDQIIASALPG